MIDGRDLIIQELCKAIDRDKLRTCWAGENGFDLIWHPVYRKPDQDLPLPPLSAGDPPFER